MAKIRFTHIAAALAINQPTIPDYSQPDRRAYQAGQALCEQWQTTVYNVADVLAADNPKFDRRRFLTACGVKLNGDRQ